MRRLILVTIVVLVLGSVCGNNALAQNLGEYKPDANTVLLLHMNETSGSTVSDASGNGHTGTSHGATIVSGRFGNARSFNYNTPITLGNTLFSSPPPQQTIEAWVKVTDWSPGMGLIYYNGNDGEVELGTSPDSAIFLMVLISGGWPNAGYGKLQTGVWYHVAAQVDFTIRKERLYIDGVLQKETDLPSGTWSSYGPSGGYPPTIGSYNNGTFFYGLIGCVDEVRISSMIRSPEEFDLQLPPKNLTATPAGSAVNLAWQNSGGAVPLMRYKVYRGTDSTNVSFIDSTTNTTYQNAGLNLATTYYYRVSAVDSTGFEGAKSYAVSATIPATSPAAPTLFSPPNGATNQSTTLTLRWNPSPTASSYRVQVATDSGFVSGIVLDDSTVVDTFRTVSGLLTSTEYYWRVNAKNAGGTSAWSSVWSFTTTSTYYGEYKPDGNTVLLLHMDETSGSTLNDASSYANNGTATGTAIVNGKFDLCRDFVHPSIQYITVPLSASLKPTSSFTVESWIKPAFNYYGSIGGQSPVIMSTNGNCSGYGCGGYNLMMFDPNQVPSKNNFSFSVYMTGGAKIVHSVSLFDSLHWFHVAGVYTTDGVNSSIKILINGKMEDSLYVPGQVISYAGATTSLYVGNEVLRLDGYRQFWGLMDEIRISKVARASEEFNLQLPPKNLTATPSGTTINLSWQNGGGAVPLMRYKIYRGTDSTSQLLIDSTTQLLYTNSGLSAGTIYSYRVSAVDSTGFEGAKSYAVSATTAATPSPPTITSFSPTSGPIGTTVTITGTNFNATSVANKVYFGAVKATVSTTSSTQLTVTVPVGATFASITVTDTTTGLTAYTNAPFIVTFTSSRVIDASSFASKVDYSTTVMYPGGVAIGDMDGDGKSDIVVANEEANTLSIFRNTSTTGSIALALKVDFVTGQAPIGLATGDFDGDGKPDLAVANDQSSTVSVFRNTSTSGSITFASKVDFTTGTGPWSTAIGDLDGDGKPDLVVANAPGSTVSVFRNTSTFGSITFASKVDLPLASGGIIVAIGDIDGDGKPDVVVATGGHAIEVFRNTSTSGSITFASRLDFAVGSQTSGVAIGDMDGDGKPDLVVTYALIDTVSILRNTSTSGSITFASKVNFPTVAVGLSVAIVDVDGDGRPDLIVGNNVDSVSVFRNTSTSGSITFASKVDFTTGGTPVAVAAGDVDGDGKPDLVVGNQNSKTVSVLRNTVSSLAAPTLASPTNGATNQPISLALNWHPSAGAISYRVHVATDSNFVSGIFLDDSTVLDTFKNVTGLLTGTKYYWRANAKNGVGTSEWSSVWRFATASIFYGEYQSDANTVLLLHMDDTSGSTVVDGSSNGKNGTATGTTIVDGRFGKARKFSSIGDVVEIDRSLLKLPVFTAEAWVYLDGYANQIGHTILSNLHSGVDNGWIFALDQSKRLNFTIMSSPHLFSRVLIETLKWYHVAISFDGSKMRLFVNGVLDIDSSYTGLNYGMDNTFPFRIGHHNLNPSDRQDDYFNGTIDEVRVSNTVRSLNEFNLQLPPKNLTASVSATTVNLNWQNGGGGVPLMRYRIYRGTDSMNVFLIDSTTSGSYSNSGLAASTTYFYRLSAVDSTGFEGAKGYARSATTGATPSPPTVTSFSPTSGPIGTSVTITGTNFNTSAVANKVYFGGKKATVSTASSTQLVVTVPLGAAYGPITVTTESLTASSNLGFVVTFNSDRVIDQNSFASKLDFPTGNGAQNAATADVDGDDLTDLVVANYGANTVSIYRNTSSSGGVISFSSKVDSTTGSLPRYVSLADIDGDGKPDLLITNEGSNTISIYRNTSTAGTVSFASRVNFSTGSSPNVIAVRDIDGDGKPDVAVSNWVSGTVSVFRNTSSVGTIALAPKLDFPVGNIAYGLDIRDIDGDGKMDLVVVVAGSLKMSVLRNTSTPGTISFEAQVDFSTASGPRSLAIGDMDGDGKPDVAIANWGAGTISVFRNTSTVGTISFATRTDLLAGSSPFGISFADIDGDGNVDLVTSNEGEGTVSVYKNIGTAGNPEFANRVNYVTGSSPRDLTIVDLNSDGKQDLAIATFNSNGLVSVLRNTISGSPSNPPAPTLSSPINGATNQPTTLTLSWSKSSGATSCHLQVSTVSGFSSLILDDSTLTDTSRLVSSLAYNTTYYWHVRAKNSAGWSEFSNKFSFTTINYPSTIQLTQTISFGSTGDINNYRMVGLPGSVNLPLKNVLPGEQPYDWNAYWDNGAAQNYQVQYDGSSTFTFSPGRAFWILSKNHLSISQNISTVSLAADNTYAIPLHTGWNLISNPFEKSVAWSDVQSLNSGIQPIHYFNQTYSQPATFDPYKGYYFENVGGLTSLRIPYSPSTAFSKISPDSKAGLKTESNTVQLVLFDGTKEKSSVAVNFTPNASLGFDTMDVFAPPGDFEKAKVSVYNPNLQTDYKYLMIDSRKPSPEADVISVKIKNTTKRPLTLRTTLNGDVNNKAVYLIDTRLNSFINLRSATDMTIPAQPEQHDYTLVVGTQSYVDNLINQSKPTSFVLYQNTPNPFNPATWIRFAVPVESRVRISIFNTLGELVRVVADEVVKEGYYEREWNAANAASGVYFYEIEANPLNGSKPFLQTKKMILIK